MEFSGMPYSQCETTTLHASPEVTLGGIFGTIISRVGSGVVVLVMVSSFIFEVPWVGVGMRSWYLKKGDGIKPGGSDDNGGNIGDSTMLVTVGGFIPRIGIGVRLKCSSEGSSAKLAGGGKYNGGNVGVIAGCRNGMGESWGCHGMKATGCWTGGFLGGNLDQLGCTIQFIISLGTSITYGTSKVLIKT